jgi:hypothetical protein
VLIIERLIPEDGGDPVPTLLSDINCSSSPAAGNAQTRSTANCFEQPGSRPARSSRSRSPTA